MFGGRISDLTWCTCRWTFPTGTTGVVDRGVHAVARGGNPRLGPPTDVHRGLFALLIAILMMQIILGWVLSLVENVRTAAESIDAGQLDVHLPEEGEHEIADLAHSLNGLIDRLRRRAEAQTRFVADASHELATPVAGIRGYVNILRDWGAEDPAMREEAVAAIDRESRRMARLCSDLLSMIRSEEILDFVS